MRGGERTAALSRVVKHAGVGTASTLREPETAVLPVLPALAPLFPRGGLARGSTVAVVGSMSLLSALLAAASQAGSWCALVGVVGWSAIAAAEMGVDLLRCALVPAPGPEHARASAALLDGFDVVVLGSPQRLAPADGRGLVARARQHGSVLIGHGEWAGADQRLAVTGGEWMGLDAGHGRLRARRLAVRTSGRRVPVSREAQLWLPGASGAAEALERPQERVATLARRRAV